MMDRKYDLLIFDWDGTLVDSINWIVECIQYGANKNLGYSPDSEACKKIIGLGLNEAMCALFPDSDQSVISSIVDAYRELYFTRSWTQADFFDAVPEMLLSLRRSGYKIAVATGKSRSGLDQALLDTETSSLFDATRCADETASKPNPLMIEQLLEVTGTTKQRALLIGDSVHDMALGNNAGIDVIAVSCGADTKESLLAHQPLHCFQQTIEIKSLLSSDFTQKNIFNSACRQ